MINENIDRLKEKLARGKILLGSHVFCGAPMLTEAISLCGFDMVWVDMEHTAIDKQEVIHNLMAIHSGGACSFVRIPWNDPVLAKPILDMGPDAIIFPYIRTKQEAEAAVAACLYPPLGVRGYGLSRALRYGQISQLEYVDHIGQQIWRVIQIEHIDAVRNLDEILEVEGVDAFVVGPNDLSASIGMIGRVDAAEMMLIYDEIGRKLTKAKRLFGVSTGYRPEALKQWIARGAQLLFCGDDISYVYQGATAVKKNLEKLVGEK